MKKTTQQPEPVAQEPVEQETDYGTLIAAEIKQQVSRALTHTGPVHPCGSCDRQTDNNAETCRPCQKAGSQADPLHQIGARLGFRGVPIDLLETLALPVEELLRMNQCELAELFDKNTTHELPLLLGSENFVSGNQVMEKLVPLVSRYVRTATRPPTDAERAAALQDQERRDRVSKRLAKEASRERRIEKARAELQSALTVVVGEDR